MYTSAEVILLLEVINFVVLAFECYSTLSFYHRTNIAIRKHKNETDQQPYPPSMFWDILNSSILSIVIGGLFIWLAGWIISLIKVPFYVNFFIFVGLLIIFFFIRNIIYTFINNLIALIRKNEKQ